LFSVVKNQTREKNKGTGKVWGRSSLIAGDPQIAPIPDDHLNSKLIQQDGYNPRHAHAAREHRTLAQTKKGTGDEWHCRLL